jgi:hypothetical protein
LDLCKKISTRFGHAWAPLTSALVGADVQLFLC